MKKQTTVLALFSFIIILTLSFTGCIQEDLQLDAVEIREYQGEKLGSVYDFRENSIKGPQYIDKQNYTLHITGLVDKQLSYTYDELLNEFTSYKKVVTLHCVEGWSVKILWDGILVNDLVEKANPHPNATIIIFHA